MNRMLTMKRISSSMALAYLSRKVDSAMLAKLSG